MEGKKLFEFVSVENLLSYNGNTVINLEPLNVLIGPNSSGKSNLVEAFELFRATADDLTAPIREGGGINEWFWKGEDAEQRMPIQAVIVQPQREPVHYGLVLTSSQQRLEISHEIITRASSLTEYVGDKKKLFENPHENVFYFYDRKNSTVALNTNSEGAPLGSRRLIEFKSLNPQQSILSQRKDPDLYPEITYLGEVFGSIKLYRDWNFGRYTKPRMPQPADLPEDFLLEDASNLGLVLNDLQHKPAAKKELLDRLQRFYPGIEDVSTKVYGGLVQVFVHEKGLAQPVPATRMSDGLLHYLCLLSILCHPTPPPFIGLEEPEIGLHPDVMPELAELLVEASQRTQLVVTTHSDALVSALSHVPESILICERDEGGTRLRRLEAEPLREWLEKYSLGELWRMGEIGGVR
jgi:predicted ATPase